MTAARDEWSDMGTDAGKRVSKSHARYESGMPGSYRNQPRLAPEEETFHCRSFFEARGVLGLQLCRFPRILANQLNRCKTTEIQLLDKDGEIKPRQLERKRQDLEKLLNALAALAATMERQATDAGEHACNSRLLFFESLERLAGNYIFHSRYYDDSVDELDEIARHLERGENVEAIIRSRSLMPTEEFLAILERVHTLHEQMHQERRLILEANFGLVMSVVKRYNNCGMNYEDLFQEGYVGLAMAVDKFQPMRGYRFSTYAVWWIRQGITQALSSHSRTIRIPSNMARSLARIRRSEQALLQTLGREPTPEEIAEDVKLPVERVRAWRKMERQPISLESPIRDQDGCQISDLIEDHSITAPDEAVSNTLLLETINEALNTLKDREREIIIHRFGLHGKSTMTLEELSLRFDVTHERIRQIEAGALEKLRDSSRRKYFDGYY